MRVRVDVDKCQGHARCAALAPDVYVLDELGYNVTPLTEVPPEHEDAARRGAMACPELAITVEEDD
jgi:ferredoxin